MQTGKDAEERENTCICIVALHVSQPFHLVKGRVVIVHHKNGSFLGLVSVFVSVFVDLDI